MTPAQKSALKAAILADATLSAFPNNSDGNTEIAAMLNLPSSPAVMFWDTSAKVQDIFDAIDFSKYTQTDAVDGTVIQTNRLLRVQTQQMNIQTLLFGRETLDMSKANIRSSLRDGLIAIPAGSGGGLVSAAGPGATNALNAGTRIGTRAEALLAAGTSTTPQGGGANSVTASLFGFEGHISAQDVQESRDS